MTIPTTSKDLYIMSEGDASTFVKIGESGDVKSRRSSLQTGNPRPLHVLHVESGAAYLETPLHEYFADICVGGEWFDFKDADPVACVLAAIKEIDAQGALDRAVAEARKQALAEAEKRADARVRQERDRVTRERDQHWQGKLLAQQTDQQRLLAEQRAQFQQRGNELVSQITGLQNVLADAIDRERQLLAAYTMLAVDAHKDEIEPELVKTITGTTKEAIDNSIFWVIELTKAIRVQRGSVEASDVIQKLSSIQKHAVNDEHRAVLLEVLIKYITDGGDTALFDQIMSQPLAPVNPFTEPFVPKMPSHTVCPGPTLCQYPHLDWQGVHGCDGCCWVAH